MGVCVSCGHELGIGRFCTNCGHPVSDDPPAARYPLFADEVEPEPLPLPTDLAPDPTQHRAPRSWWPWVAVALALALVVVLVLVALDLSTGDGDDATPSAGEATSEPVPSKQAGRRDPTRGASVLVPATAPPNQDTDGNRTTYVGVNMLDGDPETCWRMPGNGAGGEITVTLENQTHLTSVGMVNGYAKSAGDLDWYAGNRRVLAVEWVFDDGTTVEQELSETREPQTVDVDVTTRTVVVRLVSVSEPGTGPEARDYTAISELLLAGGR